MDQKQSLPKQPINPINYVLGTFALIVGAILGFTLYRTFPSSSSLTQTDQSKYSSDISLPEDAVQIQKCANRKGTLYIKTKDIPVGPVYMINEGKVIGVEFMLSQDEFIKGKSYDSLLSGLPMKVDHINLGFLSQGHEGYTQPHYHLDLYRVTTEEEKSIKCPAVSPVAW